MNIRGQEYRIEQFERQFLHNVINKGVQMTEENILPSHNNNGRQVQSMVLSTSKLKINSNNILPKLENQPTLPEVKNNKSSKVKYQFKFKLYLFEVVIAYILTISLMLLNRVVYFPFFQALMILIIGFSFLPFKVTNFFILIAIPMAIGNYNLGIWILTYPQIIICFISTYLFTKTNPKNLLWVMTTVVYSIIGFIVLPSISSSLNSESKIIVYYIYPLILTIIKIGGGVINHVILQPNIFLHQVSLFWMGFSYGLILTLKSSNIQFWYLLVFLTLDIINTRFQFCIRVIKRFFKKEELVSVIESKCSGYAAINSYHLVIFAYLVIYVKLNSAKFSYNLISYVDADEWYKPLIIWGFFTIYQTISIVRLIKNQKIMIVGYRTNTYYMGILRALGLSLGLWFFYLGLCIPSTMFST